MQRALKIAPQAEFELAEAGLWYEKQSPGLGRKFMRAFDRRVELLRLLPRSSELVALNTRRAQLRPFQYFILNTFNSREVAVRRCFMNTGTREVGPTE
jgi:hypothetical protein